MNFDKAIEFASSNEIGWSRDNSPPWGIHMEDPAPWNVLLGPVKPRGGVAGVINVGGSTIASFGDIHRPDLTFSVAKTYLALLAGLAVDDGLIQSIDTKLSEHLPGIGFDSGKNRDITWRHLLQQTSEWGGVCVGVPDQVDHYRILSFQTGLKRDKAKGDKRPLEHPGTYWEYNDVRINQLSLALLHVFKRNLPDIFLERILDPIGGSRTWSWESYVGAEVEIDGKSLRTVPGGSHWGGGIAISAHDQMLIAELIRSRGFYDGREIISPTWIDLMQQPCEIAPFYGLLTWLNTDQKIFRGIPETSIFAIGAGGAFTWIDNAENLCLVVRWIDPAVARGFFSLVLEALRT